MSSWKHHQYHPWGVWWKMGTPEEECDYNPTLGSCIWQCAEHDTLNRNWKQSQWLTTTTLYVGTTQDPKHTHIPWDSGQGHIYPCTCPQGPPGKHKLLVREANWSPGPAGYTEQLPLKPSEASVTGAGQPHSPFACASSGEVPVCD